MVWIRLSDRPLARCDMDGLYAHLLDARPTLIKTYLTTSDRLERMKYLCCQSGFLIYLSQPIAIEDDWLYNSGTHLSANAKKLYLCPQPVGIAQPPRTVRLELHCEWAYCRGEEPYWVALNLKAEEAYFMSGKMECHFARFMLVQPRNAFSPSYSRRNASISGKSWLPLQLDVYLSSLRYYISHNE